MAFLDSSCVRRAFIAAAVFSIPVLLGRLAYGVVLSPGVVKGLDDINAKINAMGTDPNSCQANSPWIQVGVFGSEDTRRPAYDSPLYSGVFKVRLRDRSECTGFLIAPQWAYIAHHCTERKVVLALFDDGGKEWSETIPVDHQWQSAGYGRIGNHIHGDYGLIHLARPAPDRYRPFSVASPDDVKVGAPAISVGYPSDRYGGSVRMADPVCTVRNKEDDSILSDCNMATGNSGGPLLVKTRGGEWKVAGICSTEILHPDGSTVMFEEYSDQKANRWTNITGRTDQFRKVMKDYESALRNTGPYDLEMGSDGYTHCFRKDAPAGSPEVELGYCTGGLVFRVKKAFGRLRN